MALSESEARKLTDEIKVTGEKLYELFLRAYEGKAWIPLGYGNFRSWASREFGMDAAYAYRLLDQAKILHAIAQSDASSLEISPMGEKMGSEPITERVIIPERQTRELKPLLKEPKKMKAVYEEAKRRTDNKPTAKVIKEVREEFKKSTLEEVKALTERKEELLREALEDPNSAYNNRAPKDPHLEEQRRTWDLRREIKLFQRNVKSVIQLYERYTVSDEDKEYFIQEIDEIKEKLDDLRGIITSSVNMDEELRKFLP